MSQIPHGRRSDREEQFERQRQEQPKAATMRKLELREIGKEGAFKYRDLLKTILVVPSDKDVGMRIAEIRVCMKILDKLDASDEAVLLTQEEWVFLRHRLEVFPFNRAGHEIVTFADDLASAEEVAVEEKKGANEAQVGE